MKTPQHSTSIAEVAPVMKKTKKTETERVQSIQLFRLSAQWQNSFFLENPMVKPTRNSPQINTSDWHINLRRPRLLQNKLKTNKLFIILERVQDSIFFCSRDILAENFLFGDDNHKRRAMHSPFLLEGPTRRSSQRDHL
jgi:hypothetical protein